MGSPVHHLDAVRELLSSAESRSTAGHPIA